MSSSNQHKATLRKALLQEITGRDPAWLSEASGSIRERLGTLALLDRAECVLCFAPMESEPDIGPFIEGLRLAGSTILLPRAAGETGAMELVRLTDPLDSLEKDGMGVRVPTGEPHEDLAGIDVALVPGVAFDRLGNRLGRGGGFYDRFLASAPELNTIGICFDFQVVEELPVEGHDRTVRHLSTEARHLADLDGGEARR